MGENEVFGCSCGSESILAGMLESAGLELTRRDCLRGATAIGGLAGVVGFAAAVGGCSSLTESEEAAEAIFHGGSILTMREDGDRVEALAVKGGRILAAGSEAEVMSLKKNSTKLIDLKGRCLMPGFFDPHSHVVLQSAKFTTANLDPKPIGQVGSIADIQRILRAWIAEKELEAGEWIVGWGYDDTGLEEMRHPSREDLDAVSTDHPILLMHISSHFMTGNSKMFEEAGIDATTQDPEGGVIQRKPGTSEPSGVLEEMAMMLVLKALPMPSPEKAMDMLAEGLQYYARAGITTAQDCATGPGAVKLLERMKDEGKLPIDVIAWPLYKGVDDELFGDIVARNGTTGRLRLGGVKLTVDGSIQGYTAFLTEPYHVQPGGNAQLAADKCDCEQAESLFVDGRAEVCGAEMPANPVEGHVGYASMSQEDVNAWVKRCDDNNVQMQVHCNGDAAADRLIEALRRSRIEKPRPELRTTVIHAQTMRTDQLDVAAEQGLTPSFFPIHVYFWGDRHRDIFLGPERAARINPSRSALDRGVRITLHHDAPIAGIDMLKVAWSAVNRVTSSGMPLGPEERIMPFEALRAITADAAWQNFEEDRKGTLAAGKLADLVILSDDPLAVDPMKIEELEVLETIKEGVTVYSAEA